IAYWNRPHYPISNQEWRALYHQLDVGMNRSEAEEILKPGITSTRTGSDKSVHYIMSPSHEYFLSIGLGLDFHIICMYDESGKLVEKSWADY
ncbi:MAG: hypothetical protein SFY68_04955, partial [Candidatus Sumerlaeia bacterium]|nr:hypothetical protein [Candidatus Sumerlaeia bacterium]